MLNIVFDYKRIVLLCDRQAKTRYIYFQYNEINIPSLHIFKFLKYQELYMLQEENMSPVYIEKVLNVHKTNINLLNSIPMSLATVFM